MSKVIKQLPIKVKVEMTGYLNPNLREWLLPSGFKGETIKVTESKTRHLTVKYLDVGEWE